MSSLSWARYSRTKSDSKLSVLKWTRKLLLICAIGSLLLNLAGIRLTGRGMFFGLMGHTMLLAPVCALAALDLFCTLKHKRTRFNTILLAACCITCIGAGSRGAVAGLGLGILTHFAHRRQGFIVVGLTALTLVAVSHLQASRASSRRVGRDLSTGIYSEIAGKGLNDTRGELWAARIREFVSNPVVGVGFQQQRIFRRDASEKFLEPGSSYLAVLSMTGLIGGIGFVVMMVSVTSVLFSRRSAIPTEYKDLLRGWAAFFSVHLMLEGYIFACGSLLCFLFWLTAGCAVSFHHLGRRQRLREQFMSHAKPSARRIATA